MAKKTVVSKINLIGAIRQNISSFKTIDKASGRALNPPYCSLEHDNVTTYVQNKLWDTTINDYQFPPYVECDYVV